jgi:hypothetical protein
MTQLKKNIVAAEPTVSLPQLIREPCPPHSREIWFSRWIRTLMCACRNQPMETIEANIAAAGTRRAAEARTVTPGAYATGRQILCRRPDISRSGVNQAI